MKTSSAKRLLSVMRTLNNFGPCTVATLRTETGCSRQAVYRLLDVLQASGYVARLSDQPKYHLMPLVRELSDQVRDDVRLESIADPILHNLQSKIVWPTSLSVFNNDSMTICHSTRSSSPFNFDNGRVGQKLPLLRTSVGLAYLAYSRPLKREQILKVVRARGEAVDLDALERLFKKIRRLGYAVRRGGEPANTSSIAVPILENREAVACTVISFLSAAMSIAEAVELFLGPLGSAAEEISSKLTAGRQGR